MVWGCLLFAMTIVGGVLAWVDNPSLISSTAPIVSLTSGPNSGQLERIWQTKTDLDNQRWTHIVIDHSGATHGSGDSLTVEHIKRGYQGLGYHFVVGNGRGAEDGSVFVGYRWLEQLPGAHTAGAQGDYLNRHAIGICLVGNGDRKPFSDAQMQRLVDLVRLLQRQLDIPDECVLLHRNVASTSAPGRHFSEPLFRERLQSF
ncbi:MAG: peptidoglycan recognition family protein [Phycisphaerales bacterium JB038]